MKEKGEEVGERKRINETEEKRKVAQLYQLVNSSRAAYHEYSRKTRYQCRHTATTTDLCRVTSAQDEEMGRKGRGCAVLITTVNRTRKR